VWSNRALSALEHLVEQIEARMRATGRLILRFSIPSESASVRKQLSEKFGCVLSTWNESSSSAKSDGRASVVTYCQRSKLYSVVKFLKSSGAAGIIAERGEFIFEGPSPAFDTFKRALKGRDSAAKTKAAADH